MRRSVVAILFAVLAFAAWAPGALAQEPRTTTMDVAIIKEEATHLFSIGWERGELSVTLIAPDGTRIPQGDPPAGTRVATSDRIVIFRVEEAMPGLWKAEYQEYDNGFVGCIVQKLVQALTVRDVTARQEGDKILVDFALTGEADEDCAYTVSLTLDGDSRNGRVLVEGEANVGDTVHLDCNADGVSSYDKWIVTVYAESSSGGFTDFHSASSPPFAFSNPDAPGLVEQLTATILEEGVQVAWQPPDGEQPDSYLAVLYGADGSVVHSVAVEAGRLEAIVPLATQGMVRVAVSAVQDTVCGPSVAVSINADAKFSDVVGFDLPDRPELAGGRLELTYDTGGTAVPVTTDIDGVVNNVTISDSGVLRLVVHNGTNRVTVSAQGKDGVWLSQSRTWMVDLMPPTLRVFEDWDALVTGQNAIVLTGNVSGADAVSINGRDASIEPNGNFSTEVPLGRGMNLVRVAATDAAGNATVYEARIDRRGAGGFPWWLVGGVWVAGLGISGYALTRRKRARA
jgi:Glucodextranase, domain B